MPLYEYQAKNAEQSCNYCRNGFELMQGIREEPLRTCPENGCEIEKLISLSSFQLKGGGWAKDLYASTPKKKKKDKE